MGEIGGRTTRVDGLLLLLAVASLAALPWLIEYWPAEEEPRRLAAASALLHEEEAGGPAGLIDPLQRLDPTTAVLLVAGRLIGILAAGKLACSLAIVALCLAEWLVLRRLAPARWTGAYLLFPLTTGPLLLRGGTPILFGLALGLSAAAILAPRLAATEDTSDRRAAGAAALLFALAGLTSPLAWFLATAALFLLGGRSLLRRSRWALLGALAAALTPAVVRGLADLGAATSAVHWMHAPLDRRVLDMLGASLATFSGWEGAMRGAAALLLVAAGAHGVLRRRDPANASLSRLVVGAAALALFMPFAAGMPPCSSMAADHLLWIACATCLTRPRRIPSAMIGATGVALAAGLTLIQSHAMREPSDQIARVVEAGRALPSGSRVLPLRFASPAPRVADPLRHAWGYVALERGIVTPHLGGRGPLLSCASPLPAPDRSLAREPAPPPGRRRGLGEPGHRPRKLPAAVRAGPRLHLRALAADPVPRAGGGRARLRPRPGHRRAARVSGRGARRARPGAHRRPGPDLRACRRGVDRRGRPGMPGRSASLRRAILVPRPREVGWDEAREPAAPARAGAPPCHSPAALARLPVVEDVTRKRLLRKRRTSVAMDEQNLVTA